MPDAGPADIADSAAEAGPAPDPAAASASADPDPGPRPKPGRPKGFRLNDRQKTAAAKAATDRRRASTGPTDAQLRDAVATLYATTGAGIAFFDQELGQGVALCAEAAGAAWLHLAQQSPAVRRVLTQLTTASATGELLMAHMPLMVIVTARVQARQAPPPPAAPPPPFDPNAYPAGATNGTPYAGNPRPPIL